MTMTDFHNGPDSQQIMYRCKKCGRIDSRWASLPWFLRHLVCARCEYMHQATNKVEFFQEEFTHIARHGVKW